MSTSNVDKKLKKRINFIGLISMCVGLNIGGTLFALTGIAATFTGPSLPIAMFISAIPVFLAIVPYSILTSAWPTTSASYRYIQLVNPALAFISILTLCIVMLVGGQPLFALAFGLYLKALIPVNPLFAGIFILSVFYLINLFGIKPAERVQTLLFFVLMSALCLFIFLGAPHVNMEHFDNLFPKGLGGVISAAGLLFTFSAGGFFVIDLGGEVVSARKILPKALLIGMVIATLFYILIHIITIGTIDWNSLKGQQLTMVAKVFMTDPFFAYFVTGGALVACATTINIVFTIISRGFLVFAEEGLVPAFLGNVNKRYNSPHWALTISYLVNTISLIIVPSVMFYGVILNLGMIFAITSVTAAGLVIANRYPDLYAQSSLKLSPGLLKAVCSTVILLNLFIFIFLCIGLGIRTYFFIGIVLLTMVYAFAQKNKLQRIKGEIRDMNFTAFSNSDN